MDDKIENFSKKVKNFVESLILGQKRGCLKDLSDGIFRIYVDISFFFVFIFRASEQVLEGAGLGDCRL